MGSKIRPVKNTETKTSVPHLHALARVSRASVGCVGVNMRLNLHLMLEEEAAMAMRVCPVPKGDMAAQCTGPSGSVKLFSN